MKKLLLIFALFTSFAGYAQQAIRDISTADVTNYNIFLRPLKLDLRESTPGQIKPKLFLGNLSVDTIVLSVARKVLEMGIQASINTNTALVTTASANAASALSIANIASANVSTAISAANTASTNANAVLAIANTANTNAATALSTANTANTNAATALSTANTTNANLNTSLNLNGSKNGSNEYSQISFANQGFGADSRLTLSEYYYLPNGGGLQYNGDILNVHGSYFGFAGNSNPQATIDLGTSGTLKIGNLAGLGKLLTSDANGVATWANLSSSSVTSALGYTPYNSTNPSGYISSVPAQSFSSLSSKPTTISGYGITDFNATGDARYTQKSNNLSDLASIVTARTNLGLGTLATQNGTFSGTSSGANTGDQTNILGNAATVTTNANSSGDVTSIGNITTIANNAITNAKLAQMATKTYRGRTSVGTGNAEDVSVANLKTDLGVDQINNTSDANKPISTAEAAALLLKANLNTPSFTGTSTFGGSALFNSTVGIGTTTPVAKLDVYGTGGTLPITGSTQTVASLALTNAATFSTMYFGALASLPYSTWIQSAARNDLSVFSPISLNPNGGNVGVGTTNPLQKLHVIGGMQFSFNATNQYNATIKPYWNSASDTRLSFGISPSSTLVPTETFHIMGGGNVGIGTITPISALQSNGTITVGSGSSASDVGTMQLAVTGTSPFSNKITYGTDGSGYKFAISKSQAGTVTDQFVVQDNGNVGIGTTTASSKLDVVGNINTSGSLYLNNATFASSSGNSTNSINARVISNSSGTGGSADGMYIGYSNAIGGMTRIFDGSVSNFVGIGSSVFSTYGINKFLFGNQTDDGTFAQFSGDVRVKGLLRINNDLTLKQGAFLDWADETGNNRKMLGLAGLNFYVGDIDNAILNSAVIYKAGYAHVFATNGTEKIIFSQNGSIGVGIDNPLDKLHISGGNLRFTNTLGNLGEFSRISAYNTVGTVGEAASMIFLRDNIADGNYGAISFNTTGSEKLRIASGGNIGINQPNPTSKLHINGSEASTFTSISTATTLGEHRYVVVTAGVALTLVTASTCAGRTYTINPRTAGVTITNHNNLYGVGTTTLTSGTSITIVSDGIYWQQVQ